MAYYYNDSTFINTFIPANVALESYYTSFIFGGEANRIVWSSDEYAFRERIAQLTKVGSIAGGNLPSLQTLDLPFMNYRGIPVPGTDRKYWKQELNASGVFFEELGYKIRATPVTFTYESTFYFHKEFDNMYAFEQLVWDDSNETQINYKVLVDDQEIENIGILGYNLEYNPEYTESDWLEKNKIRTIKADFELQTFILKGNTTGFGLVDECILEFCTMHDIENNEGVCEEIITYFTP